MLKNLWATSGCTRLVTAFTDTVSRRWALLKASMTGNPAVQATNEQPVKAAEQQVLEPADLRAQRGRYEYHYNLSPAAFEEPSAFARYKEAVSVIPDRLADLYFAHGLLSSSTYIEDDLIRILRHGLDPNRLFHFGPAKGAPYSGVNTKTLAPYLLVARTGEDFMTGDFIVVVNWGGEKELTLLRSAFPDRTFVAPEEAADIMWSGSWPNVTTPHGHSAVP